MLLGGCDDPHTDDPCECVEAIAAEDDRSPDAVLGWTDRVRGCFADDQAVFAEQAEACLPRDLGPDDANGLSLVARYTCSDVCPDAGGVTIAYAGIGESNCCDEGGQPGFDPAFGGFLGCFPPQEPNAIVASCDES